jgi:hypothetical protein
MDIQGNFFGAPKEVQLEQWRERGQDLRREIRRVGKSADEWKWKLGDWLLLGQNNLGERKIKYEAPRIWKMPWGTLKNFRWVSSVFPASRRRDGVSWEHHRVVAALPKDKQDKQLDLCEKVQTPIRKFKAGLRATQQVKEEFADHETVRKGEFPLVINPIQVTFPSHGKHMSQNEYINAASSAALLYLFESEQAIHGKKNRVQFVVWLIEKGVESLGWMPKVEEFAVARKAKLKARQADITKRDAESEAHKAAQEANFQVRKAAWEKSREESKSKIIG